MTKTTLPNFPFYPADFTYDTMELTDQEAGQYIRLLCRQWKKGPLKAIPKSLEEFFEKTDQGWLNRRLEEERIKALARYESAKKAADTRWEKTSDRNATAMLTKPKPKPKSKSITKTKANKGKREDAKMPFESEEFKKVWDTWKEYKSQEHRFKYKSTSSEQAALIKLATLADGNEAKAAHIIFNSLANGWKGFFAIDPRDEKKINEQINGDELDEIRQKYDL